MKKSVSFALGLALLTASMIPFTSASRNAYHAYITSQQNREDYRRFAEGRRTAERTVRPTTTRNYATFQGATSKNQARYQRNSRTNFSTPRGISRVSDINTTYVEATSRTAVDSRIRPFATRAGVAPWRSELRNTGRGVRMVTNPMALKSYEFSTFENDAFSVQLPVGAQAKADDAHAFIFNDLDIRIKKFATGTCDNSFGFRGCATNITKAENAALVGGKGRLISLDRVVRQTYQSDTVLGALNQPTDVYTEEFTTEFTDGKEYTLYRYATLDTDGGVYYIEVRVPRADAPEYVGVANKIFDSFRIYPQQ